MSISSTQFHTMQAEQIFTLKGQFFRSYSTIIALIDGRAKTLFINNLNYSSTTQKQLSRWLRELHFSRLSTSASRTFRKKNGSAFEIERDNGERFQVYFVEPRHLKKAFEMVG